MKPKGSIYFCAPVHLHGHEIFVTGDVQRIRNIFEPLPLTNLRIEKWPEEYAPLERYATPDGDVKSWEGTISSYSKQLLEDIRLNGSVELITIKADKVG